MNPRSHRQRLRGQTRKLELTETHTSKHTPEKATVNEPHKPSKALTSIRHAFTIRLPTDSESHLSATASAKQFQSEGNHFMRICVHSKQTDERPRLIGSLSPNSPYPRCLPQLGKL